MLKTKTEQTISNATNTQDAKKASIYKARKGYKIVQVPVIPNVVATVDEDKDQHILGKGFFWTETGELKLCYALEIPEDQAAPLNRDFERAKGEYRRAHRCKIWNKKHTKKIMCPFSNSCSKCPYADHPEEIFPSEAEEHQELSFDEVNEDKLAVAPDTFGSAEHTHLSIEMQEMMEKLKSLEDQTLYTIATMLNQTFEIKAVQEGLKEIQTQLDIDDDSMKAYATEYITYYRSYID
jgi:hypothetical protein